MEDAVNEGVAAEPGDDPHSLLKQSFHDSALLVVVVQGTDFSSVFK
jgi:hypothetical protein